ncbi:MAG: iron-sulfur cluster assembly accessory protein [Rickettsiales bacterium]
MNSNISPAFYVDDDALARLREILAHKEEGAFLRIKVLGGGCAGFQYEYSFGDDAQNASDKDAVYNFDEIRVAIDKAALPFVAGATLRYKSALGAASFSIDNPNAASGCGCGNSFSL